MKINKGFTLLELLVVIGIIGVLMSIASVAFTSAQARGRDAKRRGDVAAISQALEQYYAANAGAYPNACTGYDTYLSGTAPVDPKTGIAYTTATSCSTTAFCVCALLEATNTGNAYGQSGATCTFTGTGNKNYFCVKNSQ